MNADNSTIKMGIAFEEAVWDLLSEEPFLGVLRPKSSDERYLDKVNGNWEPDIMFELDGKQFWIGCFYRSEAYKELQLFFNQDQATEFEKMVRGLDEPLFIAVGRGGTPSNPEEFIYGHYNEFNPLRMDERRCKALQIHFKANFVAFETRKYLSKKKD